ncbi:carbohydrate ABC transporter permease, partial [Marinobacter alexandrii]|uniref:carbohydrate ABC transporter permease n=1 Tax=Marinobacter alexandrii TaxID=2570351 RepID=UPI003299D51C
MSSFKPQNNRAWIGVLPVLLVVAFSAVVPLMTVVNYSVQDILDFNTRFFVGFEWYQETLNDQRFIDAFVRQVGFSLTILVVELPLGIAVAKGIPKESRFTPIILILLALPLLIPWNVVGTIWQIFARPDIGLLGVAINALGISYNYTVEPLHAWLTLVAMDVWHWTSLIALLSFAGLTAIPKPFYQAAELDCANRWQVFRHVELPRLRGVLIIGVLLR